MSNSFYQTLVRAGAPLGVLGPTARTLCSANGTGTGVSGCSNCVVSFMGLQTEFPILICDLATGTDAIIGTDVLGTVLPHTKPLHGLARPARAAGPRSPRAGAGLNSVFTCGAVAGLIFLSAGRLRAPACYCVRAGCIFQARIVDKNNGTQ